MCNRICEENIKFFKQVFTYEFLLQNKEFLLIKQVWLVGWFQLENTPHYDTLKVCVLYWQWVQLV